MLENVVSGATWNYLQRGITAANVRNEVIANNIANVNTPHFKKSDVIFEDLLAYELYGTDSNEGKLEMARTHDAHLPFKPFPFKADTIIQQDQTRNMRTDDNNVDIDIEMASLTKNQLWYNAMVTELQAYTSRLNTVITSGQG